MASLLWGLGGGGGDGTPLTVLLILLCLFGALLLGQVLFLQDSWGRVPLYLVLYVFPPHSAPQGLGRVRE